MKHLILTIFLLSQGILISHSYAKTNTSNDQDEIAAAAAEAVTQYSGKPTQAILDEEAACRASENCDVASDVSDEERYGGIEREYVVKGCKVTIYNDGPVKMVNEITGKFCNAPIPKDHKFHKEERTYQKDGCTITEHIAADGAIGGVEDCSKKK